MLQSKIQDFQLDCIDCNETKAPLTMRLQLISMPALSSKNIIQPCTIQIRVYLEGLNKLYSKLIWVYIACWYKLCTTTDHIWDLFSMLVYMCIACVCRRLRILHMSVYSMLVYSMLVYMCVYSMLVYICVYSMRV